MKPILLSIIIVFLFSFQNFSQKAVQDSTKALTVFKLPDVNLKTLEGETINIADINNNGKPVIISFWAIWCINCIKELNAINEKYADWQKETGVKLIAISIDEPKNIAKVKPFVYGKSWDYEVYLDPNKDLYRALNVNQIPHTFLINGNGEIVWQHLSYTPGSENILYNMIKKLVAGENISE